jgi:hypothetical protein
MNIEIKVYDDKDCNYEIGKITRTDEGYEFFNISNRFANKKELEDIIYLIGNYRVP